MRRARTVLVGAGLAACVLVGALLAHAKSDAPAAQLAVIVTADVRGYLEPCGCSEHMLGGMDRAAAQVDRAQQELGAAVHVSAGDALFLGPAVDEAHAQQDALKARTLLETFARMNTVALALGPRDLPMATPLLGKVPFPVLGVGHPGVAVASQQGIALGVATGSDVATLTANVKAARQQGAEVVLALAQFPLAQLVPAASALAQAGADVAVVGHQAQELDGEANRTVAAALPIVTLLNRGRGLARVDLHRLASAPPGFVVVSSTQAQAADIASRDAEIESLQKRAHQATGALKVAMEQKIVQKQQQRDALASQKPQAPTGRSWLSISLVELSDEKPRSAPVRALIEGFTEQVGKQNLAFAKAHGKSCPAAKPGEAAFVGTQTCIGCHADPGTVWQGTRHSHAYATLEKVHKQYDLDCIRCHVIGVDAPGGVCRVDQVKGRTDVGCESCHGKGSLHADDPNVAIAVKKPAEATCLHCHTVENSPAFDYASYLPQILGPGHGQPDAKH
jgi:hypothetical protein